MANHTILLIDYEPRSIERFRQPLTDAGYEVEVATDGLTGIEAFHRLNPDMVLVEAMIPKKHGFEVCQELKRTPHGRKTPVLITTGVYKGRKYRTQALHIYGCDEYIEKPIAPEQLLAVVGKFFARTARPVESAAAASDGAVLASVPVSISHEAAPARPSPTKTQSSSVARDFTEEEIMARLDAILPGEDFAQPPATQSPPTPVVAAPETVAAAPGLTSASTFDGHDPFSQMQAELTAELGSLSAALALEPAPVFEPVQEPIPSDQAAAPSVMEALPLPEFETPTTLAPPDETQAGLERAAEAPSNEHSAQLVSFEAKRSRRKKHGKRTSQAMSAPTAPEVPTAAPASGSAIVDAPRADEATIAAEPLSLPTGTLVESDLAGHADEKRVPVWLWAALVAVALIAVYFAVLRGRTEPSHASLAQPTAAGSVATDPAVAASGATPSAPTDSGNSGLVLNSINPPPRRSAGLAANTTPPFERTPASKLPGATAPDSTPAESLELQKALPLPAPVTAAASPTPPPEAAPETSPSANAEEGVAGVETITGVPAQPAAASIAPGTLVDAADLDTAAVSLSRKLPTYSFQARQMRLQGTVVMKVLVNERGKVDDVVLVSGVPGADLNDSAMRAAKSWTYRPATKGGVPVKVWKVEQVAFKM